MHHDVREMRLDVIKLMICYFLEADGEFLRGVGIDPNKTLPKVDFRLVKTHETTPGWISRQQPVNRWVLDREIASQMPTQTGNKFL